MTLTVMAGGGTAFVIVIVDAAVLAVSATDLAVRLTVAGDGAFDGAV